MENLFAVMGLRVETCEVVLLMNRAGSTAILSQGNFLQAYITCELLVAFSKSPWSMSVFDAQSIP